MTSRRISQLDVAKRAGVSRSAVYSALSGRKTTIALPDETRNRIQQVAAELGYEPDILGRSLAGRKSFLLAFFARGSLEAKIGRILYGLQNETHRRGYSLVTYYHGERAEDELTNLHAATRRRVDGIVVFPAFDADGKTNVEYLTKLYNQNIPIVQFGYRVTKELPAVYSNALADFYNATQHLIKLGHKRILYFTDSNCVTPEPVPNFYGESHSNLKGYRSAMTDAGLTPELVTWNPGKSQTEWFRNAMAAAKAALGHSSHPTVVMTAGISDAMAIIRSIELDGGGGPLILAGEYDLNLGLTHLPVLAISRSLQVAGELAGKMVFQMLDGIAVEDVAIPSEVVKVSDDRT